MEELTVTVNSEWIRGKEKGKHLKDFQKEVVTELNIKMSERGD